MRMTATIQSPSIKLMLVASIVCLIHLLLDSGGHYCLAKEDADDYTVEWIGEPETSKVPGEKKPVSSIIYTGDETNQVTITKDFTHSFSVSGGSYFDLSGLLKVVKVKLGTEITTKRDSKTALNHQLSLAKHSKAVVMFRENLVKLKGKAKVTYKNSWFSCNVANLNVAGGYVNRDCKTGTVELSVEVKSTEVDVSGSALGTFSVEYMGTDRYKHGDYYHIVSKTLEVDDALPVDDKIKSPYECAERAELYEKLIAVYDVDSMKCLLLYEKRENGSSFDREGYELGEYNYIDNKDLDASETSEKRERERWIKEKRCDVIHTYWTRLEDDNDDQDDEHNNNNNERDDSGKNKSKQVQRHLCKSFSKSPGKVIMMKRLKRQEKQEIRREEEPVDMETPRKSSARSSSSPARTTKKPASGVQLQSRTLKPTAPASHPKFYQLNGRNYEAPESMATGATGEKIVKDIQSAYECGEQAMEADKHLAVYKPRERACLLLSVVWNHGRSMDTNGKQLGPFHVSKLHEVDRTSDLEKSKRWAEESNTNCDIIHETNEGSYSCKTFDTTSNDSSIVLIRYLDRYEIKRINRAMKQIDYENVLFSRSQHPEFYSIKSKDYPSGPLFKTITNVNSSRHCGDITLKNDKYLATFKPQAHSCLLREVDKNDGKAFDRWNHPLGTYDLPRYTIHRSESGRELERWVDLTECDFIHAKEDGTKHCKRFPAAEDSILMMKRMDKD